jgi:hypothetical protein
MMAAALKSEGRKAKSERRPNPEIRDGLGPMGIFDGNKCLPKFAGLADNTLERE